MSEQMLVHFIAAQPGLYEAFCPKHPREAAPGQSDDLTLVWDFPHGYMQCSFCGWGGMIEDLRVPPSMLEQKPELFSIHLMSYVG